MLDVALACAHHLLIFALFGVLVAEHLMVRPGMTRAQAAKVASVDAFYGVLAVLLLAVGLARAVFAAKGWAYYAHNAFFMAKVGVFLLIGALSAWPTLTFLRWRKAPGDPASKQVEAVLLVVRLQLALFALLPLFAAAMARGYGEMP